MMLPKEVLAAKIKAKRLFKSMKRLESKKKGLVHPSLEKILAQKQNRIQKQKETLSHNSFRGKDSPFKIKQNSVLHN